MMRRMNVALVISTVDVRGVRRIRRRGWTPAIPEAFPLPTSNRTQEVDGLQGGSGLDPTAHHAGGGTSRDPARPAAPAAVSTDGSAAVPALADRNRVFLLLFTLYPAILGTMLWQFIERPPNTLVWLASLLLVIHFSLDLLYLKLNTDADYYRYTWSLFAIDVALVVLMRGAFTTLPSLTEVTGTWSNPAVFFVGIYLLYVVWEVAYKRANPVLKRSSSDTPIHYLLFCAYFVLSAGLCVGHAQLGLPSWTPPIGIGLYLVGLCGACIEHYWSVFIGVVAPEASGELRSPSVPFQLDTRSK
jgi:hypothetical protein